MKVKANRDCSIYEQDYKKGRTYTVSDGVGRMLIKEGFTEDLTKKKGGK